MRGFLVERREGDLVFWSGGEARFGLVVGLGLV